MLPVSERSCCAAVIESCPAKVVLSILLIGAVALIVINVLGYLGPPSGVGAIVGYITAGLISPSILLLCRSFNKAESNKEVDDQIKNMQQREHVFLETIRQMTGQKQDGLLFEVNNIVPLAMLNTQALSFPGAVPKDEDKHQTLLHRAAELGYTTAISFLIAKGATVNVRDDDRNTPLHLAAQHYHKYAMELLKRNGAKTTIENGWRWNETADAIFARKDSELGLEKKAYIEK